MQNFTTYIRNQRKQFDSAIYRLMSRTGLSASEKELIIKIRNILKSFARDNVFSNSEPANSTEANVDIMATVRIRPLLTHLELHMIRNAELMAVLISFIREFNTKIRDWQPTFIDLPLTISILSNKQGTGKKSLRRRFCRNVFDNQAIDEARMDREIKICYPQYMITSNLYLVVHYIPAWIPHRRPYSPEIIFLLFDITRRETFEGTERYLLCLERNFTDIDKKPIVLVGTKLDEAAHRQVTTEEAQLLADRLGLLYMEVSAKDNINIHELFELAVTSYVDKIMKDERFAEEKKHLIAQEFVKNFPSNLPEDAFQLPLTKEKLNKELDKYLTACQDKVIKNVFLRTIIAALRCYYHHGLDITDLYQTVRGHRCFAGGIFSTSDSQYALDKAFNEMTAEARMSFGDTFTAFNALAVLKRHAAICLESLLEFNMEINDENLEHFNKLNRALLRVLRYALEDNEYDEKTMLDNFGLVFSDIASNLSQLSNQRLQQHFKKTIARMAAVIADLAENRDREPPLPVGSLIPRLKQAHQNPDRFEELTLKDDLKELLQLLKQESNERMSQNSKSQFEALVTEFFQRYQNRIFEHGINSLLTQAGRNESSFFQSAELVNLEKILNVYAWNLASRLIRSDENRDESYLMNLLCCIGPGVHYTAARAEAFRLAYSGYRAQKLSELISFINALPLCLNEDRQFIKFIDTNDIDMFLSYLVKAAVNQNIMPEKCKLFVNILSQVLVDLTDVQLCLQTLLLQTGFLKYLISSLSSFINENNKESTTNLLLICENVWMELLGGKFMTDGKLEEIDKEFLKTRYESLEQTLTACWKNISVPEMTAPSIDVDITNQNLLFYAITSLSQQCFSTKVNADSSQAVSRVVQQAQPSDLPADDTVATERAALQHAPRPT